MVVFGRQWESMGYHGTMQQKKRKRRKKVDNILWITWWTTPPTVSADMPVPPLATPCRLC